MKSLPLVCSALVLSSLTSSALAVTATSLSSFGGREEPTTRYLVSSDSFATGDTYTNITNPSSGVFRMTLRYTAGSSWDGDRDSTTTKDRGRAEVKVLGARQLNGQTFEYQSTWKTNSTFKKGSKFCHITQVKGYGGGDIDEPLVTMSIDSNTSAAVKYCSGTASGLTAVRSFSWSPGSSKTVKIRLKVSTTATGELRASVNGDSLQGKTAVAMYRPDAPEYQPKWGLYRGATASEVYGNDYVEYSGVQANKL
jgi:hypothetical protein